VYFTYILTVKYIKCSRNLQPGLTIGERYNFLEANTIKPCRQLLRAIVPVRLLPFDNCLLLLVRVLSFPPTINVTAPQRLELLPVFIYDNNLSVAVVSFAART
jgi:hypothetical protein